MHEQDRRPAEGARTSGPTRRASAPEHPLLLLQQTAGNSAVSRLIEGMAVQRQEYPEPVSGGGGGVPGAMPAGVVNIMAGVANVMAGVANVAGGGGPSGGPETGGGPSGGEGGGGWAEEIPVPTTGGV